MRCKLGCIFLFQKLAGDLMRKIIFYTILAGTIFLPSLYAQESASKVVPLWGRIERTATEQKQDLAKRRELLEASGNEAGRAIDGRISAGWKAITAGFYDQAIERFNEAYILSPRDYRIPWGHAAALVSKGDTEAGKKMFEEALKLSPKNGRLNADYALLLIEESARLAKNAKQQEKRKEVLAQAQFHVEQSMRFDNSALPFSRRAMLKFELADYEGAWKDVHLAQDLGGFGLTFYFLDQLKSKREEPIREKKMSNNSEDSKATMKASVGFEELEKMGVGKSTEINPEKSSQ